MDQKNKTRIVCKPPKPNGTHIYGNSDLELNMTNVMLVLSPTIHDASGCETKRNCNRLKAKNSFDISFDRDFGLEQSIVRKNENTDDNLTFDVNIASTPKPLRRTKRVVKMSPTTNKQTSDKPMKKLRTGLRQSTKSKKHTPTTMHAIGTNQEHQQTGGCCCCCCCCCTYQTSTMCCNGQTSTHTHGKVQKKVQSNHYEMNPIYLNAPSHGYQLIQIITDSQKPKTGRPTSGNKKPYWHSFRNSTKISSAMVVNSQKITTRNRSSKKHADQRNQICVDTPAATVNIGSDENQSYIHDTLLNDFNQYGQFRIWYV